MKSLFRISLALAVMALLPGGCCKDHPVEPQPADYTVIIYGMVGGNSDAK